MLTLLHFFHLTHFSLHAEVVIITISLEIITNTHINIQ